MTTMTLGDMFPQLNDCRPAKPAANKRNNKRQGPGTASSLKKLYPEIESWDGVLITKMWMHWGESNGIELKQPKERDERFMDFLVNFIHGQMLEIESGIKVRRCKAPGIDAAFQGIRQSYLDSEIEEDESRNHHRGQQKICL